MKHLKRLSALLLAVLLLTAAAFAEDAPARRITVQGQATVMAAADTAIVSLGVETTAASVTDAMTENAARIEAVLTALKAAGPAENDLYTERFYISTVYDYSSIESRIIGYTVSNGLSVTVRDMAQVGSLIDQAFAAGANRCDGVSVSSTKAGEASDQALVAAIAEGHRRAELVAAATGDTLGALISVTESGSGYVSMEYSAKGVANADMGTQIIAEGLSYTATVTLVFEVK